MVNYDSGVRVKGVNVKIGQVSKITQISARMLRYYEGKGLLFPHRHDSGYREYTSDMVETVQKIKILSEIGFTLEVIRPLLGCTVQKSKDQPICSAMKQNIENKINEIDFKIKELNKVKESLYSYL